MKMVSLEQSHEVMAKLATNIDWSEIPSDAAQRIINDPVGSGREFTRFLMDGGRVSVVGADTFPLTINYSLPLAEAIAAGKYDGVNNDITTNHFPGVGTDTAELGAQLCHFNKVMESDDVLKELDKSGFRPATLPELLAFGAHHPNVQRQFPIIALGSVWQYRDDSRHVPGLWGYANARYLNLYWSDGRWREHDRFLAVRK